MSSSRLSGMLWGCWGEHEDACHVDPLVWQGELQSHVSMAVAQANQVLEDQAQVMITNGAHGTFVGLYDGHGGPQASSFLSQHLFPNFLRIADEEGGMSESVVKKAFHATENEFLALVEKRWSAKPHIATVGSCCLVGVICGSRLYVANLGDSRVVLGTYILEGKRPLAAKRLCPEHNAKHEEVQKELKSQHPDDPNIVVFKRGAWRIKGIIQVSRSIGDVYLKDPHLSQLLCDNAPPVHLTKPVLSAVPSINEYILCPKDQFLVFASDGLWEHLSDQQVVDIVQNNPRTGIASKLVRAALQEAARKKEMRYSDLRKIKCGVRRLFHDDISVIVFFLDSSIPNISPIASPDASPFRPSERRGISMHSGSGMLNAPLNVFPLLHHGFDNDLGI